MCLLGYLGSIYFIKFFSGFSCAVERIKCAIINADCRAARSLYRLDVESLCAFNIFGLFSARTRLCKGLCLSWRLRVWERVLTSLTSSVKQSNANSCHFLQVRHSEKLCAEANCVFPSFIILIILFFCIFFIFAESLFAAQNQLQNKMKRKSLRDFTFWKRERNKKATENKPRIYVYDNVEFAFLNMQQIRTGSAHY